MTADDIEKTRNLLCGGLMEDVERPDEKPPRWDWVTVALAILGVMILLLLTYDLWGPHVFPHQ